MSRIKLYLDEDALDKGLIRALRARHVNVISAREANMLGRTDEEHLHRSSAEGRVLYSFNMSDYQLIHNQWLATGTHHGGTVVCPHQWLSVGEQVRRLLRLFNERSAEGMYGRLEFLGAWKD